MSNSNIDLTDLKHKCKIHSSDIGGVCGDMSCQDRPQMKCIKCISENQCCIRSKKHKLITITEFCDLFFQMYNESKIDFVSSKQIKLSEEYCRNTKYIINEFEKKKNDLINAVKEQCEKLKAKITELQNSLCEEVSKLMEAKELELKNTLLELNIAFNYDALCDYNSDKLKKSMKKMPFDVIDNVFAMMKKTIVNMKTNHTEKFNEIISTIIEAEYDKNISIFCSKIEGFSQNFENFINNSKNDIQNNIFVKRVKTIQKIGNLKKTYDSSIDYSTNSNFLNKHFTIYQSAFDKEYYVAYPTSLNTIKIEKCTSDILSTEEKLSKTSNDFLHKDVSPNQREDFLVCKLVGHLAKINLIKYYYSKYANKEYILSSSKDHCLKIWNISSLKDIKSTKLTDTEIAISLFKFKSTPISFDVFNDSQSTLDFIAALAKGEKIQIFDLNSGEHFRDFFDRTSEARGTYETLVKAANINNTTFLITGNEELKNIKVWSFNTAQCIKLFDATLRNANIFSSFTNIIYNKKSNSILIIDDIGSCSIINIKTVGDNFEFDEPISMKIKNEKSKRKGGILYENDLLLLYCDDGMIYQYDIDRALYIDKLRISFSPISFSQIIQDEANQRNIFAFHCEDQNLKFFI